MTKPIKINKISIAKDFSKYPSGRYAQDGKFSGENFRNNILIPHLNEEGEIEINLDGIAGLPTTFIEEAFGGLKRCGFTEKELKNRIKITTTDENLIHCIKSIYKFIENTKEDRIH